MRSRNLVSTITLFCIVSLHLCIDTDTAQADSIDDAVKRIRAVGPNGTGHRAAGEAWKTLAASDTDQLTKVLSGMKSANPLAENWLRSAAETIAARAVTKGRALPIKSLESFVMDTGQSPRGRRLAYEILLAQDPKVKDQFLPQMLDDPSLELRRDAVQTLIDQAKTSDKPAAIKTFRRAFRSARDLDQIETISQSLDEFEQKTDIARHMGFIQRWHLAAPFENTGTKGFDVAYPPEMKVDLAATYTGKDAAKVGWVKHMGEDAYGVIDLNKVLENHKGAIAYAYTEFVVADDTPVQFRLGCINGNKIWVNGKEIMNNHVYHANTEVDQYTAKAMLKKGTNKILLKIAQNEQTEPWAQRWQFQLRVCDRIGTAVLSNDRPSRQTAARALRQLR